MSSAYKLIKLKPHTFFISTNPKLIFFFFFLKKVIKRRTLRGGDNLTFSSFPADLIFVSSLFLTGLTCEKDNNNN